MDALIGWWDDYFWGAVIVGKVFLCSLSLMITFGLLGAMAKLSNSRIAQNLAGIYTVVFRGTPPILIILLFYFGSAITLTAIAQIIDPEIKFVDVPPILGWHDCNCGLGRVIRHRNFSRRFPWGESR